MTLLLTLFFLLMEVSVLGVFRNTAEQQGIHQYVREMEIDASTTEVYIQENLQSASKDLKVMRDHLLNSFEGGVTAVSLEDVQQMFLAVISTEDNYDQIRYIDASGQERIRVNFNAGNPSVVSEQDLQYKGDRGYFKQTIALGGNETYVSPLDLNMEHGEVEIPYKPTIRIAIPVIDDGGINKGLLVINYLAQDFLGNVAEMLPPKGEDFVLQLLNPSGYFLLDSADSTDEFAFMFPDKQDLRLGTDDKVIFDAVQQGAPKGFEHGGTFTFVCRIHPLKESMVSDNPQSGPNTYYWTVLASRPSKDFEIGLVPSSFIARFLFVFSAIAVLFFAALFSYNQLKRKSDLSNLKQKNVLLEKVQHIARLGFWEFDVVNNHLSWSDEVYRIFGVEPQAFEATYEAFFEFVHPEDRAMLDDAYQTSLLEKTGYAVRHRVIRADGTVLYVDENANHEFDAEGNPIRSIGTVLDTTKVAEYENTINEMKNQLESVINKIPDIIYRCEIGEGTKMIYINQAIEQLTGYPASDFMVEKGRDFSSIIHGEDAKRVKELRNEAIAASKVYKLEYRIINKAGENVFVQEIGQASKGDGKTILEGFITDVSLHKDSFGRMRKFLDIQDTIVLLSDGLNLSFANRKFFEFLGYASLEAFKRDHACVSELFIADDHFFHLGKMKVKDKNWIEAMLRLDEKDRIVSLADKYNIPHVLKLHVNSYEGESFVLTFSDISENFTEKLHFEKKALVDSLSGAYNREYFTLNIKRIIEEVELKGYQLGIIILDIDSFKSINDLYGHDVGDFAIKTVAHLISDHLRKVDTLIRWGGDEFVILSETESRPALFSRAESLRVLIEQTKFEGIEGQSCSFGCALHGEPRTIEETLKAADIALYRAKNNGKNRVEMN